MRPMHQPWLVFLCFLVLTVGMALAQRPAPTPPGGGGGGDRGGGGGNIPGRDTPSPTRLPKPTDQPRGRTDQGPFDQRPIFLSGKVVLDDGTPPPEQVMIERVCNGVVRPEAYSDSKGHFSFQLGRRDNLLMDASMGSSPDPGRNPLSGVPEGLPSTAASGGNLGSVNLTGCEIRASLPGFRSQTVDLGRRSIFDNPDIGVIILHRLGNVEGSAISVTSLSAPREARKSYEKAQKILHEKNPKPADAAKELEKAVEAHPQYAAAWFLLGRTRLDLKEEEGARKAFEQSIAADSKYINPYMQLAEMELRANRWDAAANVTDRLVALNSQIPQAHFFSAVANFNLGKMELAEKSARNVLKGDEANRFPQAHQLLGAILARQGRFPSAAEEYRSFLTLVPSSPNADQLRKLLVEWEGLGVIQRAKVAPQ